MTRKLWMGALIVAGCAGPEGPIVVEGAPLSDNPMPPPRQTLELTSGDLYLGRTATFTVSGADQGDEVEVIRGSRIGFGICPAIFGGNCLDITGPPILRIGGATANAQGVASIDVDLPGLTRLEGPHFFQAVVREAAAISGDANESLPYLGRTLIPDCVPDGFEPNDDAASASQITSDNFVAEMCEDGVDWYTRTVGPNEILELSVFYEGGTLTMELFDDQGNSVETADSTSPNNRSLAWRNRGSTPMDVTIALNLETDVQLPGVYYDLDSRLVDPTPCVDDPVEDNDTEAEALPSVFGQLANLVSCDNDPDVFEVVLPTTLNLDVDITFDEADGTVMARLYDDQGNIVREQDPVNGSASFEILAQAGTYYLHVNTDLDDTYGGGVPYALEVNTSPPNRCVGDVFEPNDVSGDAVLLTEGTYPFLGACMSDNFDWYVVDVAGNQQIEVTADFADADGNINLALYQTPPATGTSGATQVSATRNDQEVVTFTPATDVQLWIAVYITADQGGITNGNFYDLTIDLQ